RILLHFEGSDYRTEVWVNGTYTGCHEGGYSRFSFDITDLVQPSENTLTVRVWDSCSLSQSRGKQRWIDHNFGCWYVQTTGIWKTVWLEYVPEEYIKEVKLTPLFSEGVLDIQGIMSVQNPTNLELEVSIGYNNTPLTALKVPVSKDTLSLQMDVRSPLVGEWQILAWTPEHPYLYDISFRLLRDGNPVDEVFSYFGMREIRIDGQYILLNGAPLYQRLILDQGYWKDSHLTPPHEEALKTDIDKILSMGYNGVRKHQKIEDERFLYWADVKGLLVWSEMAAAYEYTDQSARNFTQEWLEILRQNYNHPSIITWTPFNESWGIPAVKTNRSQQHFTEAIYHLTKSYDKYRPVIVNDGWEHTVSDIITLHDYEELGENLLDRYLEHFEDILNNRCYHNADKSAFAEHYAYRGQPIIISEFGGIAFNNGESGWGYGNKVNTKEAFIKRFDAVTSAIKKLDKVCGYCYTQITDVQQEINGLLDMDRRYKVDPEIVREINERQIGNVQRITRK
ncbi:MAG: glycoside hydrolase family 2, partial [Treponema sp.]|nr:glycoside hydrolase family 2 [Treponema sp.]